MSEPVSMTTEVLVNMESQAIERYMQSLREVVNKDIRINGSIEGYLLEDMLQAVGSYQPIFR